MTTPLPLVMACALAMLLASRVNSRPEGGDVPPAVPDTSVTQQMMLFKTEVIKSRILNAVNLKEPPPITEPIHLPQNLFNLLVNEKDEESILEEGENLIAYPFNENISCEIGILCSRFEFDLPSDNRPMSSIHVWIPKSNPLKPINVTVCFSLSVDDEDTTCDHHETLSEVKSEVGWAIYELTTTSALEPRNDQSFCTVKVIGTSIQEYEEQKPFLVANMNPVRAERRRRSANSNNNNKNCTCCKVNFYVSFKEINWHWVVAPLGFNANMCYGKCSNQINSYPSHYHRLLSAILNNKTSTDDKKESLWTPCCSPTKLSPLNMIYVAGNNTSTNSSSSFIYHKIPDMITESCGCW